MNKFLILPLILVGCTAPVTDPPAHACSPRLDGKPTNCGEDFVIPRKEVKGEVDVYNINHWHTLHGVYKGFFANKNLTDPWDDHDD